MNIICKIFGHNQTIIQSISLKKQKLKIYKPSIYCKRCKIKLN